MELYQYWTIAGFIFLAFELFSFKTICLVLSGSALFTAVVALRFSDSIFVQLTAFLAFIPLFYFAAKPYLKRGSRK